MFAKPYKQKSNNTLKNSEKKHLCQRIQEEFPGLAQERVKELIPVKSTTSCMKLVLHSGETVGVYVVDSVPMVLEVAEVLVPTVCALWKVPEMVPTLIVHTPVLPKVLGGAPLYLPGVVRSGCPRFQRGGLVAASTQDNAAAGLIGRATISTQDMQYMAAGVCLEPIHVYGDLLCKEQKFSKVERPKLGPASYPNDVTESLTADINQLSIHPQLKEEWPSLGRQVPTTTPDPNAPKLITDQVAPAQLDVDVSDDEAPDDTILTETSHVEENENPIPSDMDGLLQWCLLSFLKLDGKHLELPLKTNLLYKNHLMPLCPPDRTLDVKKSSYKKMSKFLEAMQQEGLIEVREIDKGVDAVVGVQTAHPALRAHAAPPRAEKPARGEHGPPAVREMFCVTANVAALFHEHRKGTALTAADIRSAVGEYVRARGLAAGGAAVLLDGTLAKILGKKEGDTVKWDEVMSGVQNKFTPSTEMRFSDGTVRLTKSRLEPVTMQVATRSGNKKVTLVSNLEAFGFSLQALSHECQAGVAASCGVTRSPGAKHDQLMLQGDQTYFVAKLLIEKYGLPKKFVEGADKALKKKK